MNTSSRYYIYECTIQILDHIQKYNPSPMFKYKRFFLPYNHYRFSSNNAFVCSQVLNSELKTKTLPIIRRAVFIMQMLTLNLQQFVHVYFPIHRLLNCALHTEGVLSFKEPSTLLLHTVQFFLSPTSPSYTRYSLVVPLELATCTVRNNHTAT